MATAPRSKDLQDSSAELEQKEDSHSLHGEESPGKTPSQVDSGSSPEPGSQPKARMKRRRHITTTDESGHEELATSPRRHPRRKRRISPYKEKRFTDQETSQERTLNGVDSKELGVQRPSGEATDGSVQEGTTGGDVVANGGKGEESRKIRLELDLEAEVELAAKIRGDITLGLT